MGKDIAVQNSGGILAAFSGTSNPFLDAGKDDFEVFGRFLKFNGNTGKLEEKVDDDYEELPRGSAFLINMATAQHGWICWVDGAVEDERNDAIIDQKPFPREEDLPDYGPYTKHDDGTSDGWQEQYIFHLYDEKNEQGYTLKLSSKSSLRSSRKFLKEFGKKVGAHLAEDGTIDVPVVEIDAVSFDIKKEDGTINKKAGKKWAPTFKVIDWAPFNEVADCFEGVDAADGDEEGDYEQEETTSRGRGRQADPEPEEKATRGRGRGRSAPEKDEEEDERPTRRRRADPEPEDTDEGEGEEAADEPKEETRGRRTRVVHAEPDDDEETEADAGNARSARRRRGRG